LYYLGEKIDRKQLNLQTFDSKLEGELYKGFEWADGVTFDAADSFDNLSFTWSGYKVVYPKEIGELDWTNLQEFVSFVVNSSQDEFNDQISFKADIENLIDHYIFLNLIFAPDNIGKYIYTARNSSTSLYYQLPWDMDGSFGNNWKGERIDQTENMLRNGLFDKLLIYPEFISGVKLRWNNLRQDELDPVYIKQQFRANYNYLVSNGLYQRDITQPLIPPDFAEAEIEFIESWIDRRVIFLDSYFNNLQ